MFMQVFVLHEIQNELNWCLQEKNTIDVQTSYSFWNILRNNHGALIGGVKGKDTFKNN